MALADNRRTQTEAREHIVKGILPGLRDAGVVNTSDEENIAEEAARAAVSYIQSLLAGDTDKLANVLWSADNGGKNGTPAKVRGAAHTLIAAVDVVIGQYRI